MRVRNRSKNPPALPAFHDIDLRGRSDQERRRWRRPCKEDKGPVGRRGNPTPMKEEEGRFGIRKEGRGGMGEVYEGISLAKSSLSVQWNYNFFNASF